MLTIAEFALDDSGRSICETPTRDYDRGISIRPILYWLAAMIALLLVGTLVGLLWADTSDLAGSFAGVTNIIGVIGIVLLLIALAVNLRRRGRMR